MSNQKVIKKAREFLLSAVSLLDDWLREEDFETLDLAHNDAAKGYDAITDVLDDVAMSDA